MIVDVFPHFFYCSEIKSRPSNQKTDVRAFEEFVSDEFRLPCYQFRAEFLRENMRTVAGGGRYLSTATFMLTNSVNSPPAQRIFSFTQETSSGSESLYVSCFKACRSVFK